MILELISKPSLLVIASPEGAWQSRFHAISQGLLRGYAPRNDGFEMSSRILIDIGWINAASLSEASEHWLELLLKRGKITEGQYRSYSDVANRVSLKLQNFIAAVYKAKVA